VLSVTISSLLTLSECYKHFIIAAKLGSDKSLKTLKGFYAGGDVSKEDSAAALRAHRDYHRCYKKSTAGGSSKSRGIRIVDSV
jgi:hypothetical protein